MSISDMHKKKAAKENSKGGMINIDYGIRNKSEFDRALGLEGVKDIESYLRLALINYEKMFGKPLISCARSRKGGNKKSVGTNKLLKKGQKQV